MQRNSIGLAVIGSGRIGTLRARLASEHPAVNFIATADLNPANAKALADKVGAKVHSGNNLDIINHPDVTAVIVSTAEGQHTEAVLAAIGHEIRSPLQSLAAVHKEGTQGRALVNQMQLAVKNLYGMATVEAAIANMKVEAEPRDLAAYMALLGDNQVN